MVTLSSPKIQHFKQQQQTLERGKRKCFGGSFPLKYGLHADRSRSGLQLLRRQRRRKCQGCFLLFLWCYLDPIKYVKFRYKQLEMGPEKNVMTLPKGGLSCWAHLTVVPCRDGHKDPPSSLGESVFKSALCLMPGFNSYVFICSGRMFSAVKSLRNWDFTACWTSCPLNNQGPVPMVQCALQAAESSAEVSAQHA